MQDLIKRYFWVLGAVVVLICAVFAAKATSHVVEAKYLNDSPTAPKLAVVAPSPMAAVKATRSKDGTPFAQRNMFCSECTPPVETVSSIDPSSVITTSLPLTDWMVPRSYESVWKPVLLWKVAVPSTPPRWRSRPSAQRTWWLPAASVSAVFSAAARALEALQETDTA